MFVITTCTRFLAIFLIYLLGSGIASAQDGEPGKVSPPELDAAVFVNVAEAYHLDRTGKTDNYAKLRAWAEDVNSRGGGHYYFPRGTYLIDKYKTVDPTTEKAITETAKYSREDDVYLDEKIKIENISFKNCDGLSIIGDNAIFSVTGKFHRKANHEMAGSQYSTIWHLTPLSFHASRNILVKGFTLDGNIQDTTKDPNIGEWQGHGLVFKGCEHFKVENTTVQGFSVDGIFVTGDLNMMTKKDKISRFMEFNHVRCLRNGRQGFSMVGGAYGTFNHCEFAYTGKSGAYGSHAPGAGMDIEPHYSPLGDNSGNMRYTSDEFNGYMTFNHCKFHNNVGGALFVTSTMLTKSVAFNQCMIEVDPEAPVDSILIATSCGSTEFNQCHIQARTPTGHDASIYLFVDGLAQEKTGVIGGKVSNINTVYKSCGIEGGRIWTNENHDTNVGELGMHNFKFVDSSLNGTSFVWKTRRRLLFDNVVLYYPSDTKNVFNIIHNATIKDSLFKADSRVTIDLGHAETQSIFHNLGVQSSVSLGNSRSYLIRTNVAEGMEFYAYSNELDRTIGSAARSNGNLASKTTVILPNNEGSFGHRVLCHKLENAATYTLTGKADVKNKKEKKYSLGYGLVDDNRLLPLREQFTSETFTYTFTTPQEPANLALKAYLNSDGWANTAAETITLSALKLIKE